MIELIKDLPYSVQLFIFIGCFYVLFIMFKAFGWIFREWWMSKKEKEIKLDKAITENTVAIIKLQTQIERLSDLLHLIPKMQADIHHAHKKIRDLTETNSHDE